MLPFTLMALPASGQPTFLPPAEEQVRLADGLGASALGTPHTDPVLLVLQARLEGGRTCFEGSRHRAVPIPPTSGSATEQIAAGTRSGARYSLGPLGGCPTLTEPGAALLLDTTVEVNVAEGTELSVAIDRLRGALATTTGDDVELTGISSTMFEAATGPLRGRYVARDALTMLLSQAGQRDMSWMTVWREGASHDDEAWEISLFHANPGSNQGSEDEPARPPDDDEGAFTVLPDGTVLEGLLVPMEPSSAP